MHDVNTLREMLIKTWKLAKEIDHQRLTGIFILYQEIIKSKQSVYGIDTLAQILELKSEFKQNHLYTFQGIVRQDELQSFVTLCY